MYLLYTTCKQINGLPYSNFPSHHYICCTCRPIFGSKYTKLSYYLLLSCRHYKIYLSLLFYLFWYNQSLLLFSVCSSTKLCVS